MAVALQGFSRRETENLTGLTFHRLSYLDRSDILKPERVKLPGYKNPVLRYSWQQLLELRAIASLREEVSLQAIRKVIHFIGEYSEDPRLSTKKIVVINDEVYWIEPDFSDIPKLMVEMIVNPGQTVQYDMIVLPDLKEEILKTAKESKVIDFQDFLNRANIKTA